MLATENLPRELEGVFDAETYAKSRAYQIDKHSFKFWNGLYDMLHLTVSLCASVPGERERDILGQCIVE